MEECKQKKFLLVEGDESFDRAIRNGIKRDTTRLISNLILSAALYNEAGLEIKVKNILKQMLGMEEVCNCIKEEIKEIILSLND